MELFTLVADARVILLSKGVYKQADLYRRGDQLYAKYGSGFIGLRRHNGTTAPSVRWEDTDLPGVDFDRMGRMIYAAPTGGLRVV